MATWPISLQDVVNRDSFSLKIGDTTIRSNMDIGPDKVRRRMTKSVDNLSVSIWVTSAQYTTLYNFYDITLNGGVETFTFDHPITGVATDFRFISPPEFRPVGFNTYEVNMAWEILP